MVFIPFKNNNRNKNKNNGGYYNKPKNYTQNKSKGKTWNKNKANPKPFAKQSIIPNQVINMKFDSIAAAMAKPQAVGFPRYRPRKNPNVNYGGGFIPFRNKVPWGFGY